MGLTRQSVQRTVDSLKEADFVCFRENPAHAKAQLISLTQKGRTALQKATEAQKRWSTELAKVHVKEELNTAATVLKKLIDSLDSRGGRA